MKAMLAVIVCTSTVFGQAVLTVDDDIGQADYTSIQLAINNASNGDIVLVRPGTYDGFSIDGIGLTIAADPPGAAHTEGIRVRNIPDGRCLILAGLAYDVTESGNVPRFVVEDCFGVVHVQDSVIEPLDVEPGEPAHTARISNSTSVTFEGCSFRGTLNADLVNLSKGSATAAALFVTTSQVGLWDCTVRGVDGFDGFDSGSVLLPSSNGGDAIIARDTTLFVSGGTIRGGQGGDANLDLRGGCIPAGHGGRGVAAAQAGGFFLQILIKDVDVQGGLGGADPFRTGCSQGLNGVPISAPPGALTLLDKPDHLFDVSAIVCEGEFLDMTVAGSPGDAAIVLVGQFQSHALLVAQQGLLLPNAPSIIDIGVIPASGQIEVSGLLPRLPVGMDGGTVLMQPLLYGQAINAALQRGRSVVLLRGTR